MLKKPSDATDFMPNENDTNFFSGEKTGRKMWRTTVKPGDKTGRKRLVISDKICAIAKTGGYTRTSDNYKLSKVA